jgi:hypothetical protein
MPTWSTEGRRASSSFARDDRAIDGARRVTGLYESRTFSSCLRLSRGVGCSVLALRSSSGPGPQYTDAPSARGEEAFRANGVRCGVSFPVFSGNARGGTMSKLNQLLARLRATLKR